MIGSIISFSVRNKLIVGLLVAGLIAGGIFALQGLPIDAVPDITNNQVQVVTVSPSLAPQEVEQFITYPVEVAMANLPSVVEIRSISRFGLSVVTIVFEDHMPVLEARQLVSEQINIAAGEIPPGIGSPELMPITTGLGEIYQYVLEVDPGYEGRYSAMDLRTIQDWIVKRQLSGTPGIIEVSSFGGYLKQYEVALDPILLESQNVGLPQVYDALERNNQNSGGSYIEKHTNAFYIRTEGLLHDLQEIEQVVVEERNGIPILIKDLGRVTFGSPDRFGAMTMDGKGEAVGGITLMLKGGNSSEAIANVHTRIGEVSRSLPEGITLYPYLDRSVLVEKTTHTVRNNLIEGGLIVVFVLVFLLGDIRAGLVVASVIPLAMLFAVILMRYFGVSANLMSLGAIDFGIVVDGAVIVMEGVLHAVFTYHVGKQLSQSQMDGIVSEASAKLFRSAVFGVFIILVVFIPIMTLTGIEGKMFRPMAMTFSFAVLGALILSLTYVPMMTALVLPKKVRTHQSWADRIMHFFRSLYRPSLVWALKYPKFVIGLALAALVVAGLVFGRLGAEFIPTLEEGDLAMQMSVQPGSSLSESIRTTTKAEKVLLDHFPEVRHVVSKIGTAEVPTDPMAVEDADIMIVLKEKEEWTSASSREELIAKMKEKLEVIVGASFEFTQPIQLRFNELMTGAKTDIAVKIFGEDPALLHDLAEDAARLIRQVEGAGDVKVEQTEGLPQLIVRFDRQKLAQYGLDIETLNQIVRAAYAGEKAGVIFENERKFDLVLRLQRSSRQELDLSNLFVRLSNGRSIPLSEVAQTVFSEGPMQISREDARRRISIGINVRERDVASLVTEIRGTLDQSLALPAGYSIKYGGQFENLEAARKRLVVAVPVALALIFLLLYFTFGKLKYALMIFSAVPLSAIGGILALWLRGMPFSISAGVGFIALFGVAVLNGIVLISHFNRMRYEEGYTDIREVVLDGGLTRLRPVIMTATVAALGFLPMALSSTNGAEVQKPLATVVIGGLITATLLTLIVLPVLYWLVNRNLKRPDLPMAGPAATIALLLAAVGLQGQTPLSMEKVRQDALTNHPWLANSSLQVESAEWEERGARRVPSTNFGVEWGQINTDLLDYRFTIEQGLGNRAANRQRTVVAQTNRQLSVAERDLLLRQIGSRVQLAYLAWNYQYRRLALLREQLAAQQELRDKTNRLRTAGAIDQLEWNLVESKWLEMQRRTTSAALEERAGFSRLRREAYLPATEGAFPSDSLLPFDLPVGNVEVAWELLAPFQTEQQLAIAKSDLLKKELRPEWSVGYFNQSIRPDYLFQGGLIGLSWPIWQKAQQAQIERARLEGAIAQNRLMVEQQQRSTELFAAVERVYTLHREMEEQLPLLREQSAALLRLASLQLEQGEIDYFQYYQSLELALEARMAALDLIFRYNEAVVELLFLMD